MHSTRKMMPIIPLMTLPSMGTFYHPGDTFLSPKKFAQVRTSPEIRIPTRHTGGWSRPTGYTAHMQALKYILGAILILIGLIALVTPLTPGAWLTFVGLELIGVRLTVWDKIKARIDMWRGVQPKNTDTPDTEKQDTIK